MLGRRAAPVRPEDLRGVRMRDVRRSTVFARLCILAAVALGLSAAGVFSAGTASAGTGSGSGSASAPVQTVALAGSFLGAPKGATARGLHDQSSDLGIEVVIDPSNQAQMQSDLAAMYDPNSPSFHHWLSAGEFARLFAPSAAEITAVQAYLRSNGLTIESSSSPFLVAAYGTTARVAAAFNTRIEDYRSAGGTDFFSNSEPASVPATLSAYVAGVVGLDDTSSPHPQLVHPQAPSGNSGPHYGAGPYGSGLTPSQTRSLYGADKLFDTGVDGQGHGAVSAVFELSGYANSDDEHWLHYFYGPDLHTPTS